jgi:uncharacterized RDD family membrane protein YckC
METILINTSQNIGLEHSVASVGERIVAHFLDYLFFISYGIILLIINSLLPDHVDQLFFILLFALPVVFYDLVCELTMNGQNIGKRVMKLKVVMTDGTPPAFLNYFIRWVFRIVDNVLLFGSGSILAIILTGKGQRIGDIAARTMVIRLKPIHMDVNNLPKLPGGYQPVFPEAMNLTEKDYNLIREIIAFRIDKGLSPYVLDVMEKAKVQLEKKLHISSAMSGKDFLYALEKDFIYYNQRSN